jgi:hypothetical protein
VRGVRSSQYPELIYFSDATTANKWLTAIREAIKCDLPVVVVTTPVKQPGKGGRRFFGRRKRNAPAVTAPADRGKAQTVQPTHQTVDPPSQAIRQVHTIQVSTDNDHHVQNTQEDAQSPKQEQKKRASAPLDDAQPSSLASSPSQAPVTNNGRVRRAVLTRSVGCSHLMKNNSRYSCRARTYYLVYTWTNFGFEF